MASLKNGKNRDNCSGDVTYGQPIGKQISYRPYKRIASFNGYLCLSQKDQVRQSNNMRLQD